MDKLNRVNTLKESYKKLIKGRPYIEDALIIGGTCLFAVITAVSLKTMMKEPVDMDIKLNPNEEAYYSANYDAALKQYENNEEEDKWPLNIVKEAEIYSLQGDKLNSDVKLSNAYRERNKIISEEGAANYKDKDKALGNYISFTYLMNGEIEKSIEYGEDFLRSNSDNNDLRETLAVSYVAKGDINKAKEIVVGYIDGDEAFNIAKKAELEILVGNVSSGVNLLKKAYDKDKNEIRILDLIDDEIKSNNKAFIDEIQKVNSENKDDALVKLVLSRKDLIENNKNADAVINELKAKNDRNLMENKMILDYINYKDNKDLVDNIVNSLVTNYSDNYGANYILGEYYLNIEDFNKALEYGKKSVNLKEDYANNYGVLFPKLVEEKEKTDLNKVAPYLRRGLYYEPFSTVILENAAKYYENNMQEIEIAYNYYDLLSKLCKTNSDALYNLAILNSRREEKELAINNMKKAIELDSNNVKYLNSLGVIYFNFDEPDKGIQEIRKAYEIDKNNIQTLNNAAIYYAKYEKNINRAMSNIETAYDLSKDSKDLILKSEVEGNYKEIKRNYDLYKDEDSSLIEITNLKLIG